jgi:predicted AAA+ superfamily ATPase
MGNISHKRPEKVNFFYLHPMTFFEFLDAIGKSRYRNLLEDIETPTPLAEAFHSHLVDLLRFYYFVGGMPEAVKHFADQGNASENSQTFSHLGFHPKASG